MIAQDSKDILKALVLDDEADARHIIANILVQNGYEILEADTIADAKKIIDRQNLDLLFLDFNLPDGNSFDILSEKIVENTPTIICSAYLDSLQESQFMNLGVQVCLKKPLNQEKIVNELKRIEH